MQIRLQLIIIFSMIWWYFYIWIFLYTHFYILYSGSIFLHSCLLLQCFKCLHCGSNLIYLTLSNLTWLLWIQFTKRWRHFTSIKYASRLSALSDTPGEQFTPVNKSQMDSYLHWTSPVCGGSNCFTTSRFRHSHTDGRGCHAGWHLFIRSNLGFSILLKDTWTCSLEEPGIQPTTFWLLDNPPWLLSSKHKQTGAPAAVWGETETIRTCYRKLCQQNVHYLCQWFSFIILFVN